MLEMLLEIVQSMGGICSHTKTSEWFHLIYAQGSLGNTYPVYFSLQRLRWHGTGRFNGIHFSFQSKELSRKNSSHSKVKADALWDEQERLIYGAWNWKCGLRMTMRNKITWLADWISVCVCVSLGREALRECSCHPERLRLPFSRGIETFRARWKKVGNALVSIKTRTPFGLFT